MHGAYSAVCPEGFEWFDQSGCIALVQTPANKDAAIAVCQKLNPRAKLMMPKTSFKQIKLQQYAESKSLSSTTFFLGMSKATGYWLWDDGTPVFVQCKLPLENPNWARSLNQDYHKV